MAVVPKNLVERIEWWEAHLDPFSTHAVAIGITTAEATELATKTADARAKYDAHVAAMQASKVATQEYYDATDVMTTTGAALLKKVRGKAEQVGGNTVYNLAEIPAPATPTSVGAPGLPYKFGVTLKPNGTLELTWKCDNPVGCNGVIYQVYRKVESSGEYNYLGGTGERKFVDLTLPSGVPSVMYQVQGTRSTAVGDVAEFTVKFGTTTSGTVTATVIDATPKPPKIAA